MGDNKITGAIHMPKIFHTVEELIGGTPLFHLETNEQTGAKLLVKLEFLNPGGSIKDRAALSMIQDAEAQAVWLPAAPLSSPPRATPASDLACVAASRGYRLDLPRAGRFDPAKPALNVPVLHGNCSSGARASRWKAELWLPLRMCWARHAGVCGSCSRVIPLPARHWNRPRSTPTFSSAMPPTPTTSRRRRQSSGGTALLRRVRPLQKRLACAGSG